MGKAAAAMCMLLSSMALTLLVLPLLYRLVHRNDASESDEPGVVPLDGEAPAAA